MSILHTPIDIGKIKLKNRLVMPPMAISKADEYGRVTENTLKYYDEKSRGGYIGLIIAEHSYVSLDGKASKGQLSISNDNDISGLQKLVSIVHKNDTKIMAQINHAGGATTHEITGTQQISASAIRMPKGSLTAPKRNLTLPLPKKISIDDIKKTINDFVQAAIRAKTAGFDGVEIHYRCRKSNLKR